MKRHMQKGALITFEGIDGSGKSTIAKKVVARLHDEYDVLLTTEPTHTWIGNVVRRSTSFDADPLAEFFLFMADHAEHIAKVVKPALDEGKIIISDRYSDSRYAYQGVTLAKFAQQVNRFDDPMQWIKMLHEGWTITPNLTFLFIVAPDIALNRCNQRSMQSKSRKDYNSRSFPNCDMSKSKFENLEFLQKVQDNFLKLADKEPERFVKVDAEKGIDEIEKEVVGKILKYLRMRGP